MNEWVNEWMNEWTNNENPASRVKGTYLSFKLAGRWKNQFSPMEWCEDLILITVRKRAERILHITKVVGFCSPEKDQHPSDTAKLSLGTLGRSRNTCPSRRERPINISQTTGQELTCWSGHILQDWLLPTFRQGKFLSPHSLKTNQFKGCPVPPIILCLVADALFCPWKPYKNMPRAGEMALWLLLSGRGGTRL